MKKLLIVLTVVSMAALLFTGCLPNGNTAPVITYSASQTATTGEEFTSTVTATDAEGDTLTYSVSGEPTDMVIDSATGVISGWTPAAAGTETVLVTVTDGKDPSTLLVTITVSDPVVPELEITIAVAGEYLEAATGKTYVQGGNREIIVTFPDVVENPVVKVGTVEVPVFTLDNKVFKGTGTFVGDAAVLIKVTGACEDICAAKSVVVDSTNPYAKMLAEAIECDCDEGWKLKVYNNWSDDTDCVDLTGCCATDLASWNVKIYDENPWAEECCDPEPCILPIAEADGTACPITITTECIGDVYTHDNDWIDFFDNTFWVIATLTDNVNNQIKYLGEVGIDGTADELLYFRELYIDVTSEDCVCPAESLEDAADLILGDCDGTPTTECWVEPPVALTCPTVTPETVIVGVEATVTLTFNRDVDEAVDGQIMAYISDAAKITPLNIPDNALPLFLEQDAIDLEVFTGEVTFETPGSKVLYVLWDCDSCEPCMYEINVTPIEDCPEIAWFGTSGTVVDGVTWLKGGDTYTFELTFDHVITDLEKYSVEIDSFDSSVPAAPWSIIFYDLWTLADMTTINNMVFEGTFTPPALDGDDEYCTEAYVRVQVLEPADCCDPCMFKFGVDAELPEAEITITAVANCGLAFLEFSSIQPVAGCPDNDCCGDDCTSLASWTIDIYDTMPIWDCCVQQKDPIDDCSFAGVGCPVDVEQGAACEDCCLENGDYWIVTTLTDAVGNVNNYNVKLTVTSSTTFDNLEEYVRGWACGPGVLEDTPFDVAPTYTDGVNKYGVCLP